jgi:hypothetical protein
LASLTAPYIPELNVQRNKAINASDKMEDIVDNAASVCLAMLLKIQS